MSTRTHWKEICQFQLSVYSIRCILFQTSQQSLAHREVLKEIVNRRLNKSYGLPFVKAQHIYFRCSYLSEAKFSIDLAELYRKDRDEMISLVLLGRSNLKFKIASEENEGVDDSEEEESDEEKKTDEEDGAAGSDSESDIEIPQQEGTNDGTVSPSLLSSVQLSSASSSVGSVGGLPPVIDRTTTGDANDETIDESSFDETPLDSDDTEDFENLVHDRGLPRRSNATESPK